MGSHGQKIKHTQAVEKAKCQMRAFGNDQSMSDI